MGGVAVAPLVVCFLVVFAGAGFGGCFLALVVCSLARFLFLVVFARRLCVVWWVSFLGFVGAPPVCFSLWRES